MTFLSSQRNLRGETNPKCRVPPGVLTVTEGDCKRIIPYPGLYETSFRRGSKLDKIAFLNPASRHQFWIHSAIPPITEALFRSRFVNFQKVTCCFKNPAPIPSTILDLSRIPSIEMSAPRSRQGIFIPYPALDISRIPHPASIGCAIPHPAKPVHVGAFCWTPLLLVHPTRIILYGKTFPPVYKITFVIETVKRTSTRNAMDCFTVITDKEKPTYIPANALRLPLCRNPLSSLILLVFQTKIWRHIA